MTDMTKEEDGPSREELDQIKVEVERLERENFDHLHLFRTTRGWWKLGGPSALIYAYDILPRLEGNRVANLREDRDKVSPIWGGTVSIPSAERFERDVEKLGIKKLKKSKKYIQIYKLTHKYNKDEIRNLHRRAGLYKKRIKEVVTPREAHVGLLAGLEEVMKITYQRMRKDPDEIRRYYTLDYARLVGGMYERLMIIDRGVGDPAKSFTQLVIDSEKLAVGLGRIAELGIWNEKVCLDLIEKVAKIGIEVKDEYARLRTEMKKEKKKNE